MKKIYSIIVILLLSLFCGYAQEMSVQSFVLAETDLTANTPGTMKHDQNGNVCALIKVETTQDGFTFDVGSLGVSDVKRVGGEIWVYVPFGVRRITVSHQQLGVIRDYQFPCAIEKGRTYIMKLTAGTIRTIVEHAQIKQFLHIRISPSDAILEINGKIKHTDNGVYQELLPFGRYQYKAYRQDYHDFVGVVEVSDPNNTHSLDLKMRPAFGYLSVIESNQSDITDALVYVDDKYIGNIPVTNVRLSSGSHRIRVLKELYEAYDASFSISDEQTTMLTPSLVSDFAEITLITTSGADIYVNGEYKGKTSWKGKMASGSYIFETRKQGHISYKMPYDISRNDQGRIIQVQGPAPINGSLVISSVPSEARIYIEGKYVGVAPKYITNQLIGDYDVSVELDGYEKQTKHISVKEGQETNVSFTLKRPFVFDNSSSDGLRVVDSKKFTMYVGESVIAKLSEGTVTKWSIGSSHVNSFYASGERLTARQVGKTSIFGYINGLPKLFEITIVSSKNEAYSSTTSSIEVSPTSSKTLPVQKIKAEF